MAVWHFYSNIARSLNETNKKMPEFVYAIAQCLCKANDAQCFARDFIFKIMIMYGALHHFRNNCYSAYTYVIVYLFACFFMNFIVCLYGVILKLDVQNVVIK